MTPLVLVAGAGPTGMTAAIELRRAGMEVRIIDKSDHPALYSQALVVQARTLEQFQRYGIADEAVARGRRMNGGRFWSDGKLIADMRLAGIASRYPFALTLPQTDTEALLNQRMEQLGARTERKTELVTVYQGDGGLEVVLRLPDGTEEEVSPRWLIGCDGAHSVIRQRLGIPFEGGGVGLSFFLGDLVIDGPDTPGDEIALHLHHGDVVFMARLTDELTRVIVVNHEAREEDRNRELTIKDFQDAADACGVRIKVHAGEWMTPFNVNDRQARRYRLGDTLLAGDASHIHSPAGGQGMNTGIQDAANLAWKLAAVARGADDALLDSYEEERAAVGRALLQFTERGLKFASTQNSVLAGLRDTLMPLLTSLKPVQRAMLGFVSETAIEYRSSSFVADHGGDGELRAGDRLPDLALRGAVGSGTLLGDWTEAKHWAMALDGTAAEVSEIGAALPGARVAPLSVASLDDEGQRLLGREKKLLILRPDGYLGFRGPIQDRDAWMTYARQDALDATRAGSRMAEAAFQRA
jgi:2-polyprenyl-6-methoxyphenol hydroxylase-like FAD-dependent oxidoreductase